MAKSTKEMSEKEKKKSTQVLAKELADKKVMVKKKSAKIKEEKSKKVEVASVALDSFNDNVSFGADIFFKVFFEGWKNAFNLKGRSSRFELWCFLLVNSVLSVIIQLRTSYILSPSFLRYANMKGMDISEIEEAIAWASLGFWACLLLPLVPLFAMLIRRMHDIGKLAWHNYLEPMFMGVVVLSMLLVAIDEISGTNFGYTVLAMSVCFVTIFYSVLYYGVKFMILTLFKDGDKGDNEYGKARYKEPCYEDFTLKLSVFYVLFIFTIGMLYWGSWYF